MPIFTLEFDDPLFAAAFHPEKPEFVLGFASGQVTAYKYDLSGEQPTQLWTTKRHKESCRAVGYSQDGQFIYTAGSDKVLKKAASDTGKVKAKTATPVPPSAIAINDTFLAVGDDEGTLKVYDLEKLEEKYSFECHEECITSVTAMEYKNKYHFLTTGMSEVVHVDVRKGILTTSEDQEDEMLCGCVPNSTKSVFGMSEGVLTIWNNEHLLDQQNRVRLSKESVDSVIAGEEEDTVVAGTADGFIFDVHINSGKPSGKRTHSLLEEVSILDWDHDYHLASASLGMLKLWNKGEVDPEPEPEADKPKKDKKRSRGKGGKSVGKRAKPKFDL